MNGERVYSSRTNAWQLWVSSHYSLLIGLNIHFPVIRMGTLASTPISLWVNSQMTKPRAMGSPLYACSVICTKKTEWSRIERGSNKNRYFTSERRVQYSSNHQQKETVVIPTVLSFITLLRCFRNSSEHVYSYIQTKLLEPKTIFGVNYTTQINTHHWSDLVPYHVVHLVHVLRTYHDDSL